MRVIEDDRIVLSIERSLKLRSIPIRFRFRFRYRSFYRPPKIVKIIEYTFYINGNVSTFFRSQLQSFSHAKGKVHSKQLKQPPYGFTAPSIILLKLSN